MAAAAADDDDDADDADEEGADESPRCEHRARRQPAKRTTVRGAAPDRKGE